MLDGLALATEVGEGGGTDGLGLISEALRGLEALGAPVEAVGTGEQLLALLKLDVAAAVGVVRVALTTAKQRGAVLAEGAQLAG